MGVGVGSGLSGVGVAVGLGLAVAVGVGVALRVAGGLVVVGVLVVGAAGEVGVGVAVSVSESSTVGGVVLVATGWVVPCGPAWGASPGTGPQPANPTTTTAPAATPAMVRRMVPDMSSPCPRGRSSPRGDARGRDAAERVSNL